MYLLALETATSTASVAVMQDGILLAEHTLCNTRAHSETILPMVETLMQACSLIPGDLSAIAVDHGPGSFTGVRIGVSIANAMGQALCIPVVGVSSLRILYEPVSFLTLPVCAMLDARNDTVYAAFFQGGDCLREPAALPVDELLHSLPHDTLFVGDGAKVYATRISKEVTGALLVPDMPRAGALCRLAYTMITNRMGDQDSNMDQGGYREAVPLYLRPSQAERLYSLK